MALGWSLWVFLVGLVLYAGFPFVSRAAEWAMDEPSDALMDAVEYTSMGMYVAAGVLFTVAMFRRTHLN